MVSLSTHTSNAADLPFHSSPAQYMVVPSGPLTRTNHNTSTFLSSLSIHPLILKPFPT